MDSTGLETPPTRDRSRLALAWYRLVQLLASLIFFILGGLRASGRENVPKGGGAILVSNHLSHLDVFALGLTMPRPLNYVARSTLFVPVLGPFIRSVGGFPIQREGMGASGVKETIRRVRGGGIALLFPEGTRSPDGEVGELKPGIAAVVGRLRVPIIPAAVAGTFEMLPRSSRLPRPHPIRVHYGPPITPEQLDGLDPEAIVSLIRDRLLDSQVEARRRLAEDRANWAGKNGGV